VISQLGANLTCVDANQSALHAAEQAIQAFPNQKQFIHTPLEHLDQHIEPGSYDLAFSWGVIHHCKSFNQSLRNVANAVKDGGILYLYLYGEESIAPKKELEQFKLRVKYNYFMNDTERYDFLLEQASGNPTAVHNYHDAYAPLINRRLGFAPVKAVLEEMGFTQVTRTIDHPELFIRAVKGQADYGDVFLPPVKPPYWFNHHRYQKS
jgi:SAM-dependent methyltransferase